MKLIRTILLVVATAWLLNLQSGCQEAQKTPESQQALAPPPKTPEIVKERQPKKVKTTKGPLQIGVKPAKKKKVPRIKVKKPVHNFGKVGPNKRQNCEFVFKNVGNGTLKITKVQTTCGCTVAKLEKKTYAPGESGSVNVNFRTPTREGKTTKRLYILSNDKKNPKVGLTLKATVELKIAFKPKSLDLSLRDENAAIKPVTIKSKDGQSFAIKSFTSSRDVVTADFDPTVEATEFVLEPKVDIGKLKKNLKGNIRINVTHPQSSQINIPYSTLALFDISRPRIVIQNADPKKPVVKTVWIKSNYGDKIEIESVSSSNGHMEVLSQQAEENGVEFEVQVTPPPQTDKSKRYFRDELRIKVKGSDDLVIRCNGWYPRKKTAKKSK
jgi:hypothetical protein